MRHRERTRIGRCWRLLAAPVLLLSACATLDVTEEAKPSPPSAPIPAKLGVHLSGEALKKAFSNPDRTRLGLAPGQYFLDIRILPPDTRYAAPQDLLEQFGVDLVLQLQIADTKVGGGINALFGASIPLMYFMTYMPIATIEHTVWLEATLRDTRTGRLVWAKTESTLATDHFSPTAISEKVPELAKRGLENALVKVFDAMKKELATYRPGSVSASVAKFAGAASAAVPAVANRYAIVVGIEQYRERIPKADFAVQDAKDVAQFLTKQGGYREENVILRLNEQATKSDMEKYFEAWLKNNVDANSSLVIYFSGHGAPQATTGDAYLVPYDGDPTFIEQTGYPLKRLYQTLDKLPTRNVVVMLDSCFSGSGGRSVLAKGTRPMVLTAEGIASSTKAVVLAATSGSNLSLADQETGHGLFTYYALQGMGGDADANGDGTIDVQELFEYLKPQVQRVARRTYNTEQVPQLIVPSALAAQPPVKLIQRR